MQFVHFYQGCTRRCGRSRCGIAFHLFLLCLLGVAALKA